jgi:hypothetical protein
MLVNFKAIKSILLPLCISLWPFGNSCGYFCTFSSFGMLYQEKSGNPGRNEAAMGMQT